MTLYTAAEGTAAAEISATPDPATWTLFGTNGAKSMSDEGLSVTFEETVEPQRVLGSTAVQKLFRTEEDVMITINLLDVSAEFFAIGMSGLTVSQTAAATGTGGYRSVPLLRGFNILNQCFLARGFSPYGDNMNSQFWIPKGYASFSGALQYQKGEAVGMALEIMAIEHQTLGYGQYQAQDAAPL